MSGLGFLGAGFVAAYVATAVKEHLPFNKVAEPYRAEIRAAAARHGVSDNILSAILFKESSFNPNAVGSSGEVGLGQFMEIAAQDVGTSQEELRGSPALQIDKAAQLLALNSQRFDGNIFDAVRAYNVGTGKARKESAAGSSYALDVLKLAATDYLYDLFSGAVHA